MEIANEEVMDEIHVFPIEVILRTLKGGTAPLGLIFEDFVHFLKK